MPSSRASADSILAAAIAGGRTHQEAALLAAVSTRTVTRRAATPEFRAEVARLRTEMLSRATGALTDGMTAAAGVLRDLLASSAEGIRLRAADKLLENARRMNEINDLAERIAALEARKPA
jgi:hypothetical protein